MAYKDYRDPLYGFVGVNENEQRIIDSLSFQRLRNVRQLGTTFLVYPTANHTRFEHSLGTLEVATRLFDAIVSRSDSADILKWSKEETVHYRQMLRYAALLHDVGHPPFSHASEELLPTDHEQYTYQIITHPEIGFGLLDKALGAGSAESVAEIATGAAKGKNEAFLSELLTGDMGADRLDYLLRDSYHLGVSYGRFDVQRLLNTFLLNYDQEKMGPELAVEDGGVHTVEGFLLARYFMFLEVYFHKTRRILDVHLTQFLRSVLPDGRYPVEIGEFIQWNDTRVLSLFESHNREKMFARLFHREHLRLAFETTDHPERDEVERFDWLRSELEKKYPEDVLCFDEAAKAPYNYEKPPVSVLWQGRFFPIERRSPLVKNLRKIQKMRVYALPELRDDVRGFCETFWHEREQRRLT